ncbi:MAG: hypothetical protein IKA17_05390 [Clostridia bacterium]|nr:hypothetical protein [Clostridia bacterium]
MKAIIFPQGEGTRLRPLTCNKPKLLLPIVGRSILEHIIRLFRRHNILDISICKGYLSSKVEKYIENNIAPDLKIDFIDASYIKNFLENDDCLLLTDDVITDIDITRLIDYHKSKNADITLVTRSQYTVSEYGYVSTDEICRVTDFNLYADIERSVTHNYFMGIMLLSKGTLKDSEKNIKSIVSHLLRENKNMYSYSSEEYIYHITDSESYFHCTRDFLDKKVNLPFPCDEKESGIWISPDAKVLQGAVISPPVYIGAGSTINRGARIEGYSVVGENTRIESFASIKRSIIMDNSIVGEGAALRGTILSRNSEIGVESATYEGSIIGEECKIGKHCIIRPSVKIWPNKAIENESCVSSNIVWENDPHKSIFCDGGFLGRINCEITPEFASLFGSAVSKVLGDKIAVSYDSGGYSSMVKHAISAGIQSFGAQLYDLGEQPLPITRSAVRFYNLDGGISISTYCLQGEIYASLDIINSTGASLEDDKLKFLSSLISSGEVYRTNAKNIKEAEYLFEYKLYYLKNLINSTSKKPLSLNILISCPSHWAAELLKGAATDLGSRFTFINTENENDIYSQMDWGSFDFGVIIDYKCETLTLISKDKKPLSEYDYHALVSLIIMKSFKNATIYTPVSSPESIDILARKYNATIKRTPLSPPSIMNELTKHQEMLYLKQFIYRFDAVGALIMLMDYIGSNNLTLEGLLNEIPISYMHKSTVSCPVSRQGEVLEKIKNEYNIPDKELQGGIKIPFENGWVIIVPSKSQSEINVISHGSTEEYARELCDICTDDISK